MAATKLQIAMRRNALKRHGPEFVARLASAVGMPERDLRLLSAEESFKLQEGAQQALKRAEVRYHLDWAAAIGCIRQIETYDSNATLVVFLSHYPDFPVEVRSHIVFENLRALVDFDGDLVSVAAPDASAGFMLDPNSDGTVSVTLRGRWCDICEVR